MGRTRQLGAFAKRSEGSLGGIYLQLEAVLVVLAAEQGREQLEFPVGLWQHLLCCVGRLHFRDIARATGHLLRGHLHECVTPTLLSRAGCDGWRRRTVFMC